MTDERDGRPADDPRAAEYLILARLALAGIARRVAIDERGARRPQARGDRGVRQRRAARLRGDAGVVTVDLMVSDDAIEIMVEDDGPASM